MLFDLGDGPTVGRPFGGTVLRVEFLSANDLIEIVRQLVFVLRQLTEAALRFLQCADFSRHDRISQQCGAFRRFCSKLFCCEHGTLPFPRKRERFTVRPCR